MSEEAGSHQWKLHSNHVVEGTAWELILISIGPDIGVCSLWSIRQIGRPIACWTRYRLWPASRDPSAWQSALMLCREHESIVVPLFDCWAAPPQVYATAIFPSDQSRPNLKWEFRWIMQVRMDYVLLPISLVGKYNPVRKDPKTSTREFGHNDSTALSMRATTSIRVWCSTAVGIMCA